MKNFFTKSKLPIPELSHIWSVLTHLFLVWVQLGGGGVVGVRLEADGSCKIDQVHGVQSSLQIEGF